MKCMPLMYVCPEQPDDGLIYAAVRDATGRKFVDVVDDEVSLRIMDDDDRHVMDDGSIAYVNLPDAHYEELIVELDVEPVSVAQPTRKLGVSSTVAVARAAYA